MAEFKLGRIRFVWKDSWANGTTYYKDDIVAYGGRTYLCVVGHTAAADFYTDLDNIPTKWNQFSDGQEWKGDWAGTTLYKENDIVKYGGYVYICNNGHTSSTTLETNQSDWDLFAESFDWQSTWVAGTVYKVNDIVKYGGYTYLCNTAHTAAATNALGLEDDQSSWDVFSKGFDWKTDWAVDTRYKVGDVVKYGGTTYVCNLGHTSAATNTLGLEDDQSKWDYFNKGFEYKGQWLAATRYKVNDLVKNGGGVWICTTDNTSSSNFTSDQSNWAQFVEGIEFNNEWDEVSIYQNGDIVRYGGYTYIAKTSHNSTAISPPSSNTTDWDLFAEGFRFAGAWDSVTEFKVGEIVTNGGYTYVASLDSTNQQPPNVGYWTKLNDGIKWQGTWTNGTAYVLGDTVKYGPITYVCVLAHTAATLTNRPDVDVGGTYWNQLTAGNEESVLTTTGDLVYYSGSGVTRLPIGEQGQVLTVGANNQPEWSFFGRVKKVYYVGAHGVNEPAPVYGVTIDKPWASIRYACEQILKGTEYPEAGYLLKMNRTFIQEEVLGWVSAQITGGLGIWSGFTNDNTTLCKRDMGLILDAFIYDLTHTGNKKTIEATNSYFTTLGALITAIADEEEQLAASIEFMLTLVEDVLANTAPAATYQGGSPVLQIIDVTHTAETGALDYITDLSNIITTAVSTGSLDSLPEEDVAGYCINVKTGQYYEVLPIRVPANTAIVGDELRSTRVSPAGKLIATNDKVKSIKTLQHIQSITGDIITNTAVTPSSGNTETQDTSSQKAGTGAGAVTSLSIDNVVEMKKIITSGISSASAFVYPNPTGYNTSYLIGYGDARAQLVANKAFIVDEITEWIADQIAGPIAPFSGSFTYDSAACARDVGYIVDALIYDLTYGGNLQTIVAARSYFSNGSAVYGTGEKDEIIAAYGHLKAVIGYVITENTGWSKATALTQDTSGTAGTATFTNARMDEIIAALTADTATGITENAPSTSWVDADLAAAGARLLTAKPYIQTETIEFINKQYPELVYDATLCSRDVGYIVDALSYDAMFGSNFMSIKAGMSYKRSLTSTGVVTSTQLQPTLATIDYIFSKAQAEVRMGDSTYSIISNTREMKAIINNNAQMSFVYPDPTGYGSGYSNARRLILANKTMIKDEVEAYMLANYSSIWSGLGLAGQAACKRDIGYIVDALAYDLTYGETSGCNLATIIAARAYYSNGVFVEPSTEKTAALAVQAYVKTFIDNVVLGTTGWGKLTATAQDTSGTPGSAGAATFAQDRIQEIYDTIDTGDTPTLFAPSTGWVAAELVTAKAMLDSVVTTIQSDAVHYIKREYPTLNFDETLCSRDIGYIIDALGYDMMFGSNFLSIQNGMAYLRGLTSTGVVINNQLEATSTIIDFLGEKASKVAASNNVELAEMLWSDIIGYANAGLSPIVVGTNKPTTDVSMIYSGQILQLNKEFLAAEAAAYIDNAFTTTTGASSSITNAYTSVTTSWMVAGDEIVFSGTAFGGVTSGTTYYVKEVLSSTTFTISETLGGAVKPLSTATGSMTIDYNYDSAACKNDIRNYVEAIAYDMMNTGNYKSTLAARYYRSALTGSKLEDFYYISNGCGIRNQTLIGLDGTSDGDTAGAGLYPSGLYAAGEFGTQRPVAGAYTSLDPGWGPNDTSAWVTNKSTYVQNVTTFGDGCVGQKIDGSIHSGGVDSMVSNDFTQVLSNGIGAWVTNLGRVELVSVFTYYNHIGYLAENGGKIRATNGNNSYGDFGSVAEGVDIKETPVTGFINNQGTDADVRSTITNGTGILTLEYGNAGSNYSTATYTISGAGYGAATIGAEIRDAGVFQVRLTDPGDSSGPGGTGYITQTNVAQTGDTTSITLAVADTATSAAYVGMSIFVIAGTGAGQYGYIQAYNSATKVATVYNESTGAAGWEHVRSGTAIVSALDGTSQYQITPRLAFTAPTYTSTAKTLPTSASWNAAGYGNGVGSYTDLTTTGSATGSLATFDVTRIHGTYSVEINTSGIFYQVGDILTIAGDDLGGTTPANDLTIEVTETLTGGGGQVTGISVSGTAVTAKFVALANATASAAYSLDGSTWTAMTMPSSESYTGIAYGQVNDIGYYMTTASGGTAGYYSTDGLNWTGAALPASATWSSVAYGNERFVAVASGATSSAISTNGQTWASGGALPNTNNWSSVAYGNGVWVAVASTSTSTGAYSTNGGSTWTSMTLPSTGSWYSVTFGDGLFVAIRDGSTAYAYSLNGQTWIAGTLPGTLTEPTITYGQGVFLAVSTADTTAYSSQGGIVWATRTLSTGANPGAIVHGNPGSVGQFVSLAAGSSTVASQIKCGATTKARAYVESNEITEIWVREPGSNYASAPTMTITDPNNTGSDATYTARVGNGALAQPLWTNTGTGYLAATATITGDGYADNYQIGTYIGFKGLTGIPKAGSNVQIEGINDVWYRLVSVSGLLEDGDGTYKATLQVSPPIGVAEAPEHEADVTIRIRYSQVRLTGHDFLDIGTGGTATTNYPDLPTQDPDPTGETVQHNGGRVFYTSTDQDGNFRVGGLFNVEQATGIATLNADAFNIAGLNELSLGSVALGGSGATITEFSTDPFFTQDSDSIIPTQRAIKAYITSQIGGGESSLNVNTLTAGVIYIAGQTITTTTGVQININTKVNFKGGIIGDALVLNYFLLNS